MEADRNAPYAPASAVISLIRRLRDSRLPNPLILADLPRLGVSEGNSPRTLQAMRLLGLIDEAGAHSPAFTRLGKATTTEYPALLAEVLRAAYAPVFQIIDPATASETDLVDAFRGYQPQGQRDRMIKLFTGLAQEAGIIEGGPPETIKRARKVPPATTASGQPKAATPLPRKAPVRPGGGGGTVEQPPTPPPPPPAYAEVVALVRLLPPERRWTAERRNRWLQAVTATIDLLIEVEGPAKQLPLQLRAGTDGTATEPIGQPS